MHLTMVIIKHKMETLWIVYGNWLSREITRIISAAADTNKTLNQATQSLWDQYRVSYYRARGVGDCPDKVLRGVSFLVQVTGMVPNSL